MKPLYLSMKDFMNHGESIIEFNKLENATIIVGKENGSNKSSIGTGKTNIFNAIKYSLFNSKISNSKEKVVRNGANKCVVIFVFELSDGNVYKIERSRTKTTQAIKIYVRENDDWKDISAKTTTQTDELIISIIGINEETFENSSYLKQNDQKRRKIDTLASATPEDRKSIISNMLQLGIWGKFEKKAKDFRDEASLNLGVTKSAIESIGEPDKIIFEKKQQINALEKEIISLNEQINQNTSDVLLKKDKQKEYNDLLDKNDSNYEKDLKRAIVDLTKNNNELATLKVQTAKWKNESDYIKKCLIETEQKQKHDSEELEKLKSSKVESNNDSDLSNILNEISKLKATIREDNATKELFKKPSPDNEICFECGTELNEAAKEKGIKQKNTYIKNLKSKISKDEDKLNKLMLEKAAIESNITKNNQIIEKINKLALSLSKIPSEISDYKESILLKNKMIESCNQDIINKVETINAIEKNISDLKNKIIETDRGVIENNLKTINNEIIVIESKISSFKSRLSSATYELGQSKAVLDIKEKDLEKLSTLQNEKKSLEKKLLTYKAVVSCFNSSGIPAMIVHSVLDALQNETNKILEMLIPGLQLKFVITKENDKGIKSDTLDIIYYINGIENDFSDLSGGQQSCVVLAMKFATANISRRKCGSDIKTLLLDEVEAALDEQSIDNFYDIVKNLSKEMTILIITHNKDLQAKFNSRIIVNKENGISKAKIEALDE